MTHRLFSDSPHVALACGTARQRRLLARAEVVQSFAQEAARAELKPQNPFVPTSGAHGLHTREIASERSLTSHFADRIIVASVSFKPIDSPVAINCSPRVDKGNSRSR